MLVITSPKLTALVVLGVPLVIAPILLFGRRVRTRRIRRGTPSPLGGFIVVRFAPKTIIPPLARSGTVSAFRR